MLKLSHLIISSHLSKYVFLPTSDICNDICTQSKFYLDCNSKLCWHLLLDKGRIFSSILVVRTFYVSVCICVRNLNACSHRAILCECNCDFLIPFCETVQTVWLPFISFLWITYRNCTEWVWNPFMCDVTHTNTTAIITSAPYEQYHWHPHDPFLSQSHSQKTHRVNKP